MNERPKIIDRKRQTEAEVVFSTPELPLVTSRPSSAATVEAQEEPERLEASVKPSKPMLSDLLQEFRLDDKESNLDVWEEVEDDLSNEGIVNLTGK